MIKKSHKIPVNTDANFETAEGDGEGRVSGCSLRTLDMFSMAIINIFIIKASNDNVKTVLQCEGLAHSTEHTEN